VGETAGREWSGQVGAADWIRPRLGSGGPFTVTSVVPAGFEGYARILHPAQGPAPGDRVVRWAEVAAWSGLPLRADSQFHSVALPRQRPARPAPGSGQPEQGALYPPDATVLASILRGWTATPDQCWFCLWDGYGYDPGQSVALVRASEDPAGDGPPDGDPPAGSPPDGDPQGEGPYGEVLPDATARPARFPGPVPSAGWPGPRVELPHREYLLYTGPVEAAVGAGGPAHASQGANLWWPQDHAWCAASEIDLPWTYVGGPAALIDQLVADQRIEAQRASPGDAVGGVEPWITDVATAAAGQLLTSGEAVIATALGTVRAYLHQPPWHRRALLRTETAGGSGSSRSSRTPLSRWPTADGLRDEIVHRLVFDVIGLVEG
jgi:hypothetical protein